MGSQLIPGLAGEGGARRAQCLSRSVVVSRGLLSHYSYFKDNLHKNAIYSTPLLSTAVLSTVSITPRKMKAKTTLNANLQKLTIHKL